MGKSLLPKGRSEQMLAVAGLAMIASQVLLIGSTRGLTHATAESLASVLPLILGLSIPAGALLLAAPHLVRIAPSRYVLLTTVLVGVAMRLAWLGATPPLEDDYQRYLWDGAVVAHGLDPYAHAPATLIGGSVGPAPYRQIASGAQATLKGINFPEVRTIYPSVAQAAFALAHVIAPFKIDGLRVVLLIGELTTLGLLLVLLRGLGLTPLWSLLYWWNPLPATMLVGLAHVDALVPPLVLGAVLAMARGRTPTALVLIGLGAGV